MATPARRQIIVDDLMCAYLEYPGKGSPFVMLHGWADSSKTFEALIAEFPYANPILVLDLPGFGATQPPVEGWGVAEYAVFVKHFLQKLGIDHVRAVIGHSNGGAIAVKLCVDQPHLADALILLASAGVRSTSKQSLRRTAFAVAAKAGKFATKPLGAKTQRHLRAKLYSSADSDFLVAPHMSETFKKITSEDIRGVARELSLPTLLLYGQNDNATPPQYGQLLESVIQGSALVVLPDADHFLHQTHADQVIKQLQLFL